MKRLLLLLKMMLVVCFLASCGAEEPQKEPIMLVTDDFEEVSQLSVAKGTVKITEGLSGALVDYDEEDVFLVSISFAAMVSEDYLESITQNGISAAEYLAQAQKLSASDPEEARRLRGLYDELRYAYYDECVDRLSYSGEKIVRGFVCKEHFFFYTYMTKSQILSLRCQPDEALCVFAVGLLK